jgi:hypothetical protein
MYRHQINMAAVSLLVSSPLNNRPLVGLIFLLIDLQAGKSS